MFFRFSELHTEFEMRSFMKSFAEVFDKVLEFVHEKVKCGELTAVAYDMWISSILKLISSFSPNSRKALFYKTTRSFSRRLF